MMRYLWQLRNFPGEERGHDESNGEGEIYHYELHLRISGVIAQQGVNGTWETIYALLYGKGSEVEDRPLAP